MPKQVGSGVDWMSLAAKMFMNKLNTSTEDEHIRKQTHSRYYPPPQTLPPTLKPRTVASSPQAPSQLPPDCVATIRQFEALRIQLLRQLVLYQSQLIALKMPPIACQPSEQMQNTFSTKAKGFGNRSTSSKVKQQICANKSITGQNNKKKKWEQVQNPTKSFKTSNRQSQTLHKPKKSMKKFSKKKLEVTETSSKGLDDSMKKKYDKKCLCQSYNNVMRNVSSSTDSFSSSKNLKSDNLGFDYVTKENMFLKSSLINALNLNGQNSALMSKAPQRKSSKLNKEMCSNFACDTTTDEAQSSM